jgi:hypothetical protein
MYSSAGLTPSIATTLYPTFLRIPYFRRQNTPKHTTTTTTMPSTKSQIFLAAATLTVLAGSIFRSVSAAPVAGTSPVISNPGRHWSHSNTTRGRITRPKAHDHVRGAALSPQAHNAAHQARHTAAHARGSGQQHDFHAQSAAYHRNIANNHRTATQTHHHARRQLDARSGLSDGLETLD